MQLLREKGAPEALAELDDITTKLNEAKEEQRILQEAVYDEVRAELQARHEQDSEWVSSGEGRAHRGGKK